MNTALACTPGTKRNADEGGKNRGRSTGDEGGLDGLTERHTVNHVRALNPPPSFYR